MTPYRWPGISTQMWLNHRTLAGSVARLIIKECIEDRAAYDDGPTGAWCREMVIQRVRMAQAKVLR